MRVCVCVCVSHHRVVEYEARAAAALQQALSEEQRLTRAKRGSEEELAGIAAARDRLQVRRDV